MDFESIEKLDEAQINNEYEELISACICSGEYWYGLDGNGCARMQADRLYDAAACSEWCTRKGRGSESGFFDDCYCGKYGESFGYRNGYIYLCR